MRNNRVFSQSLFLWFLASPVHPLCALPQKSLFNLAITNNSDRVIKVSAKSSSQSKVYRCRNRKTKVRQHRTHYTGYP